jgi:cutinase
VIGSAAILLSLSLLSLPAAASAQDPCAEVTIIGVPGSGQSGGLGPQVEAVADRAGEILDVGGRTSAVRALDYPAIDLARTFGLALFDGRYADSVAAGADALAAALLTEAAACPETVFAVVGYSQGAQVIRASAAGLPATSQIAAIVLIADPTASLADAVVRIGGPRADDGSLGAIPLPTRYLSRTIDVCAAGDRFCGSGRLAIGAHSGGYGPELSRPAAARVAVLTSAAVAAGTGYPAAATIARR